LHAIQNQKIPPKRKVRKKEDCQCLNNLNKESFGFINHPSIAYAE